MGLVEILTATLELFQSLPQGHEVHLADYLPLIASVGLFGKNNKPWGNESPLLVQEQPGFHLAIADDVDAAGEHAALIAKENYDSWLESDWGDVESQFKCDYFTIAVGGGNTVTAEYRALLEHHSHDIDWLEHVRFFFLEESCNEKGWRSSRDSLVKAFITPLAGKLVARDGVKQVTERLELDKHASKQAIVRRMLEVMTYPIDLSAVKEALKSGDHALAMKNARLEARRYQTMLKECLGERLAFHLIISGIGKEGGIGAFTTYSKELKQKKGGVLALEKANGAFSVALNRDIMTAADCISLIISGSLKLKALGRFELEESADFEQTVAETPIRMFRETREIAEKVYIFADERALHFDEGLFKLKEQGNTIHLKSEVRDGQEENGIHVLLEHGFMGLYSYINMLIRLPSSWKVSALHRGKRAKKLSDEEVFPHYALALRRVVLQNWRYGRPTPIGCHSMAGVISDHLLLSVLDNYHDELPEFDALRKEDQQVIEALRAGGLIHLATWAPTDVCHIEATIQSLTGYLRRDEALSYTGPEAIYNLNFDGGLELNSEHCDAIDRRPVAFERMMKFPGTELGVNAATGLVRYLLSRKDVQRLLSQRESPYALRLIGHRLLKTVSFYGLLKEVNAALHDPYEYQNRHTKALDAIIKYDIPFLSMIHKDDFMVSARRHQQEYEYLMAARMKKDGVSKADDIKVPLQFSLLEREAEELPVDPINPHLLVMWTSEEGDRVAREITSAITDFVNGNVERAIKKGTVQPLASVRKWRRKKAQQKKPVSRATSKA